MLPIDRTLSSGTLRKTQTVIVTNPAAVFDSLVSNFASRALAYVANPNAFCSDKGFTVTDLKNLNLPEATKQQFTAKGESTTFRIQDVRVSENLAFLTVLKKTAFFSNLYLIAYDKSLKVSRGAYPLLTHTIENIIRDSKGNEKKVTCLGIVDSYVDLTDPKVVKVFAKSQKLNQSFEYNQITLQFPYTDGSYDLSDEKEEPIVKSSPVSTANPSSSPIISSQARRPNVARQNLSPSRPIRSAQDLTRQVWRVTIVICVTILVFVLLAKLNSPHLKK